MYEFLRFGNAAEFPSGTVTLSRPVAGRRALRRVPSGNTWFMTPAISYRGSSRKFTGKHMRRKKLKGFLKNSFPGARVINHASRLHAKCCFHLYGQPLHYPLTSANVTINYVIYTGGYLINYLKTKPTFYLLLTTIYNLKSTRNVSDQPASGLENVLAYLNGFVQALGCGLVYRRSCFERP